MMLLLEGFNSENRFGHNDANCHLPGATQQSGKVAQFNPACIRTLSADTETDGSVQRRRFGRDRRVSTGSLSHEAL